MITRDEFEDLVNESNTAVVIGKLIYGAGTVLRAVDPEQFNIEYCDYIHAIEESVNSEE